MHAARWRSLVMAERCPFSLGSEVADDRATLQLAPRIVADPSICHGQAVVAGTRMPVAILVGSVAAGMAIAEIAREYDVTEADVRAALEYAAKLAAGESFHPLPAA